MSAAWEDLGRAGNLLQLLGVDAFGLVSMITQAALTARRNRGACLQLAEHVRVVEGLLRRLQMLTHLRRHPETRRPLEQLDDALRRAYLLVRSCGDELDLRSYLYQLLTGTHTNARMRAAEEEIDRYIRLIPMISLVATVRVEIIGEPKPGFTLRACGFPINGTTLCNFQWTRHLDDGSRQSIQGATIYDYVVTADDVNTVLVVECTPMDENGLQGESVKRFSNGKQKISCGMSKNIGGRNFKDSGMQNEINACFANGEALFNVFTVSDSSGDWDPATLMLSRTSYQVKHGRTDEVMAEGIYSQINEIKVPIGRTTQFAILSSGGVNLQLNTSGTVDQNDVDNDVRLRDLIVLVMRVFQEKAFTPDAEEEGVLVLRGRNFVLFRAQLRLLEGQDSIRSGMCTLRFV
ncbi:hypothetical protein U9M48_026432 [Paspalum notatum var. saurae]|uniref:Uncharacterized protein n=1 Tax=Paspalum notatum var. saurae TaxID=547442 RepID=A0AAQ3WZ86_PASNO